MPPADQPARDVPPAMVQRPARAVAVVDSRNVHGWAGRILGSTGLPSVDGVARALAPYGFEVARVCVSVAIADRGGNEQLQRRSEKNRRYRDEVRADPRGFALVGDLTPQREKRVDVLCAVEICRQADAIAQGRSEFEAILVLSHDTDLLPAVDYALERNVPTYVVTADAHDRPRPWVLLGEHSLRVLVGQTDARSGGRRGGELRRAVAEYALTPRADDWYVEAEQDPKHRLDNVPMVLARTQAPSSIPGVAPAGSGTKGSVLKQWWATGVHLDQRDSFPFVELGRQPVERTRVALYRLRVHSRVSATRLLAEPATRRGDLVHLEVPPGGPVDQSIVLAAELRDAGKAPAFRYVACMTPSSVAAVEEAIPVLACAVETRGSRSTVAVTRAGHALVVRHAADRAPAIGRWHAVWVIDAKGTTAVALSSALPE